MKSKIYTLPLVLGLLLICACKKDKAQANKCFSNATTVRQVLNKQATVKQQSTGLFYIIEQGTIDTKLNPCNLTPEFQIDNLLVTISGDIKSTIQGGPSPCCTENFVITKITR